MRKKYIVGNWKMFKTAGSAKKDFLLFKDMISQSSKINCDVGICPPFVFLNEIATQTGSIDIFAQNVHWKHEGAFTGEISIPMLKSYNVDGSLVAHSERRQYFNETNFTAGKKIHALLSNQMKVIYCVGESLIDRENGNVYKVIETQIREAFSECRVEILSSLLSIAYEPVWAIGTGKAATPNDAHNVHAFIRNELKKLFGHECANSTRILYGGSVKLTNIAEFLEDSEIDGALVGGASLNPKEFFDLCNVV